MFHVKTRLHIPARETPFNKALCPSTFTHSVSSTPGEDSEANGLPCMLSGVSSLNREDAWDLCVESSMHGDFGVRGSGLVVYRSTIFGFEAVSQ